MTISKKRTLSLLVGLTLGMGVASSALAQQSLQDVMKARGLTQKDLLAAAKTYTPAGATRTSPSAPAARAGS